MGKMWGKSLKYGNFSLVIISHFFVLKWQNYKVAEAYIFSISYCKDTSIVPPSHTHNSKVERVPRWCFRKWYVNLLPGSPGTPHSTYHLLSKIHHNTTQHNTTLVGTLITFLFQITICVRFLILFYFCVLIFVWHRMRIGDDTSNM